jgi:hypothetical protein
LESTAVRYTNIVSINTLLDIDMRSELERYRHFDILNVEKMSPRFLSIVKQSKKFDSLDCIQRPDGTAFASAGDRETYIREYFQDIYRDKSGDQTLPVNCIEEFLGQDICNHNVVVESKLTKADRILFRC